jgi:hypothetical protein
MGLTEAHRQELQHMAALADKAVLLGKIKELVPAYTGWPKRQLGSGTAGRLDSRREEEEGSGERKRGAGAERKDGKAGMRDGEAAGQQGGGGE